MRIDDEKFQYIRGDVQYHGGTDQNQEADEGCEGTKTYEQASETSLDDSARLEMMFIRVRDQK